MSASEIPRCSYQRLKPESDALDELHLRDFYEKALARSRNWSRPRRVPLRRRSFKLRIPSLRRFIRRKSRLISSSVKLSFSNVVKRLKESQNHLGDLFAGNYLFLQVAPSLKCVDHAAFAGFSSRYSVARIAN